MTTVTQAPCIEIMLSGAGGQMGQAIEALVEGDETMRVVARFDRHSGFDNQPLGDVIIDFSHHSQSSKVVAFACQRALPLVIGTTALTPETQRQIAAAATMIPICQATNFSVGAAILGYWVQQLAAQLPEAEIQISETHHIRKQDAPSGTALTLKALIESVLGPKAIQISSHREGDVIGTHEVCFSTDDEVLTLRHMAKDRRIFARGAVLAARKLCERAPGAWPLHTLLGLAGFEPAMDGDCGAKH